MVAKTTAHLRGTGAANSAASGAAGMIGGTMNAVKNVFRNAFVTDVANLEGATNDLWDAHYAVKRATGTVDAKLAKKLNTAAIDYHDTVRLHKAQNGHLGASISSAFEKLGFKFSNTDVPKDIVAHSQAVLNKGQANMVERVLSKPFRVAPRATLLVAAAAATVGIANWFRDRAEERTQGEAMTQLAEAQMRGNPYMNSVTPQESAILADRMRGGNGQRNDFGEKMLAA